MAADEAKNLAKENAMGETCASTIKRVRSTRGVERVSRGCTSEWRTVGRISNEEQKYVGNKRSVLSVRRCPLIVGVRINLKPARQHPPSPILPFFGILQVKNGP